MNLFLKPISFHLLKTNQKGEKMDSFNIIQQNTIHRRIF